MALSLTTTKTINSKIKHFAWYSSAYIKSIQTLLNACGYKLVVDGIAGYYTINAVYSFQAKYGLIKDGIPGPITLAKLKSVIAPTANAGTSIYMTDADWKANEYFDLYEFRCGCIKPNHTKYCDGYPVKIKKDLITALTMIRTKFGKPVIITSGGRCKKFNATLKGASPTSAHLKGSAADFYVSGTDIKDVLAYCAKLKALGYIKYYYTNSTNMKGAVHINI